MKSELIFKWSRGQVGLAGMALCALLAGCAGEKPKKSANFAPIDSRPAAAALSGVPIKNDLNPELLQPGKAPFTLGPGDAIEVEIISHPASRALTVVGLDGKIYYSLLPGLDVWGL